MIGKKEENSRDEVKKKEIDGQGELSLDVSEEKEVIEDFESRKDFKRQIKRKLHQA